jgi:5-methylcytosine-specific restriction endonuclease McrA
MALNSRYSRRILARRVREQDGRCLYCRRPFTAAGPTRPTIEHRKAKMDGGSDRVANLAAACLHCNRLRGRQMVRDRAKARAAARASRKPGHEQPTPA